MLYIHILILLIFLLLFEVLSIWLESHLILNDDVAQVNNILIVMEELCNS